MNNQPRIVIVSPCHNEEKYLPAMLDSMVQQTLKPVRWVIVDDNSSDSSAEIIKGYASEHPWIRYVKREQKAKRDLGARVVHVFNAGLPHLEADYDIIMKMDVDLSFPPDTFERAARQFDDQDVGMAGVALDLKIDGEIIGQERYAPYHVTGAFKMYRAQCFKDIGGLQPYHGWDILDETEARRHGWKTTHDPGIRVNHHRIQGKGLGLVKGRVNWGLGAYAIGSHPLFACARAVYRMFEPPYIIGGFAFLWGYVSGYFNKKVPRYPDKEFIRYIRREQLYRMFHGNRLPESGR